MPILVKYSDIAEATEQYIVHQTNCTTNHAKGLAQHLFKRFPEANVYSKRYSPVKEVVHSNKSIIGDMVSSRAGQKGMVGMDDDFPSRKYDANSADIPGTIVIRGKIINMMAQYEKGKPNQNSHWEFDSAKCREKWFYQCMLSVVKLEGINSIAFPYLIGCGLAGGDWDHYCDMIRKFSKANPHIKFVMYKYDPKSPKSTEKEKMEDVD